MKFYLISDNTDTQTGLRLAGIEGCVVHTKEEVISKLLEVSKDPEVAIVLLTTKIVELAPEYIATLKLKQAKPLLTEIPDRHDSANIGATIDRYISEAIGIKLG